MIGTPERPLREQSGEFMGTKCPACGHQFGRILPEAQSIREEATLAEHKSHIDFENELYATLADPLAEGPIKEAEMRKQLLESARWYRQHVFDLETQRNSFQELLVWLRERVANWKGDPQMNSTALKLEALLGKMGAP